MNPHFSKKNIFRRKGNFITNKKIISVIIVCVGVIVSIWIFEKESGINLSPTQKYAYNSSLIEIPTTTPINSSDWILPGNTSTTTDDSLPIPYKNQGTVTDKISQSFFSQYMNAIQQNGGNTTISDDEAAQIAQNTLASPSYLESTGVVYSESDIHVNSTTSTPLAKAYYDSIARTLAAHNPKGSQPEMTILDNAVKNQDETILSQLDPIIDGEKGVILDLLNMTIPSDAVHVHLYFLNAASNVLANTEAIRETLSDPVKAFAGLSQYQLHVGQMEIALLHLRTYFKSKGVDTAN